MGLSGRTNVFHDEYRRRYKPWDYTLTFTAGADPSAAAIVPKVTGFTLVLVRATFNCTTSAAQTLTVRDDAASPVALAIFPSNPGVGTHQVSFEPQGIEATFEKNIDLAASGAGLAGTLLFEGYYLPVGARTSL
jgi:hypothetical protein